MKERSWSVKGRDQAEWMRHLRLERENFRVALSWALENDSDVALHLAASLGKYWDIHGDWAEGRRWLERALTADGGTRSALDLARAQQAAGTLALQQEDYDGARSLIEFALQHFRTVGDLDKAAWALNDLAIIAFDADGDIGLARKILAECLDLAVESGSEQLSPLINLGWLAMEVPDWDDARAHFEKGLALAGDDAESAGWCWLGLATLDWREGQLAKAKEEFRECVRVWQEIEAESTLVFGFIGLALIARDTGDLNTAAARIADALELARRLGGGARYVFCLGTAGSLLAAQGRLEDAVTLATATEGFIATYHWPIKRWFRDDLERWAADVKRRLDPDALARSQQRGGLLGIGDALRLVESLASTVSVPK